jgi:hypothetical protein
MTVTPLLPRRGEPIEDVKLGTVDDTEKRHWGVTTLIGVLDKPALLGWAAKEAAICAIKQQKAWRAIEEESGTEEARKWIAAARFRSAKGQLGAADLGSTVHACCEDFVLLGVRPDNETIEGHARSQKSGKLAPGDMQKELAVINTMIDHFAAWLDRFQPVYQASEVTVYHPDFAYAGTCDGFLSIDGLRLIFDIKTTREPYDSEGKVKTPYPEVALQLAAYRYAKFAAVWRPRRVMEFRRRYYVLSEKERELAVPVPEVDRGAVLHITPEHCEMYPVRCDEKVFERFLHVVECARWKFEMEQHVVGAPLVPAGGGA